jgi:hypothetical protein
MLVRLIASRINNKFIYSAKIDELKLRYPEFEKELEKLNWSDPSKKGKYLEWGARQLVKGHQIEDITPTINAFHKNRGRLKFKDIYQYEDLKELEDEIKSLTPTKREEIQRTKASGSTKIYEDDESVLIRIDSKRACIEYGKGTKWCITMEMQDYYEEYSRSNTLFYFVINKKLEPSNPMSKIAIAIRRDEDNKILSVDLYDALDKEVKSTAWWIYKAVETSTADAKTQPMTIYADVESNPQKYIKHSDPDIRAEVARLLTNLPVQHKNIENLLSEMMHDESPIIRKIVAEDIDEAYLPQMMHDENEDVRVIVVERIDEAYLPQMIKDPSAKVRKVISKKVDDSYLLDMIEDENHEVRLNVAKRIDPDELPGMMLDSNPEVRTIVAKRIDEKYLPQMLNDEDPDVKLIARQRMIQRRKMES